MFLFYLLCHMLLLCPFLLTAGPSWRVAHSTPIHHLSLRDGCGTRPTNCSVQHTAFLLLAGSCSTTTPPPPSRLPPPLSLDWTAPTHHNGTSYCVTKLKARNRKIPTAPAYDMFVFFCFFLPRLLIGGARAIFRSTPSCLPLVCIRRSLRSVRRSVACIAEVTFRTVPAI